MSFAISQDDIPSITTPQMIEVDRLMMGDYRIGLIQMMENAGRNLAHFTRQRFLEGDPRRRHVVVLAGPGGNGGGALVAARRLACWGAEVTIVISEPIGSFKDVPAHQLTIAKRMGLQLIKTPAQLLPDHTCDVILDGLIGYSLSGPPHGPAAELIKWANTHKAPSIALDTPSGIDAGTGQVLEPAVMATATLTLALPKEGLRRHENRAQVGELYCADISVPPNLYAEPSLNLSVDHLFAKSDIIRVL